MAKIDAQTFVDRTIRFNDKTERALKNGERRTVRATVNATRETQRGHFVAFALMPQSDVSKVINLVDEDGMIETDEFRDAGISSVVCSNNDSMGITNVTDEQFQRLFPGAEATIVISANQDDEGNWWYNARVVDTHLPQGIEQDVSDVKVDARKSAVEGQ